MAEIIRVIPEQDLQTLSNSNYLRDPDLEVDAIGGGVLVREAGVRVPSLKAAANVNTYTAGIVFNRDVRIIFLPPTIRRNFLAQHIEAIIEDRGKVTGHGSVKLAK